MPQTIADFRQAEGDSYGEIAVTEQSNNWWKGTKEFANDPMQIVRDPGGTVAGAADAGMLSFDEGVGGLTSLFDDKRGNTAGVGSSPAFFADRQPGQARNPDTVSGKDLKDNWDKYTPDQKPLLDAVPWNRLFLVGAVLIALNAAAKGAGEGLTS